MVYRYDQHAITCTFFKTFVFRDVDAIYCAWYCVQAPWCVSFQATIMVKSDCAFFDREFICGADNTSQWISGPPLNNPYMRTFNKKGL